MNVLVMKVTLVMAGIAQILMNVPQSLVTQMQGAWILKVLMNVNVIQDTLVMDGVA